MNRQQDERPITGDLYLFGDNTGRESLWGIFDKRDTEGRIVLEVASTDFVHFTRNVTVPVQLSFVRPATRSELRDFAYNMGYSHI